MTARLHWHGDQLSILVLAPDVALVLAIVPFARMRLAWKEGRASRRLLKPPCPR